jgi:hypothetical protein
MDAWHASSPTTSVRPDNSIRVLYGINEERREVQIQAIGVEAGNRLLVAGEEVEL